MATKYPIVLVHGVMLKDILFIRAFGGIVKRLQELGNTVYTSDQDGFGSIENNAKQLRGFILDVLELEKTDKVNVIAHSKGGLDTLYMIEELGMADKIASVSFLCTPHKGSIIADKLYTLPKAVKGTLAFWLNFWYKIFGDESPDALTVCRQLCTNPDGILKCDVGNRILMQSFSAKMESHSDDFLMSLPHVISHYYSGLPTDGLVDEESSKFGFYRGNVIEGSVSHTEIVDFMTKKAKKEEIYSFYEKLCDELSEHGL